VPREEIREDQKKKRKKNDNIFNEIRRRIKCFSKTVGKRFQRKELCMRS